MKNKVVKYAILNHDGVYTLSQNCNVFTDNDVIIIEFDSEKKRDDYLLDNEIVIHDTITSL